MDVKTPKTLLIAASPMAVSFLTARLNKWACETHFASTWKEANELVSNQRFDLVLSEFGVWDGSRSYQLESSLIGSNATLVYSYPVETSCWWLPAVKHGQSCWGSLAMRPSEFFGFLDEVLKEIRSPQTGSLDECGNKSFNATAG